MALESRGSIPPREDVIYIYTIPEEVVKIQLSFNEEIQVVN
jgi:hypothetical protein